MTVVKEHVQGRADVDQYVAKQKLEFRGILEALRRLVKKAAPDLDERLKWRQPCYVGKENVCAIAAMRTWVDLFFFRGAELKDPRGLLEGTGKGMRHIKVQKVSDIDPDDFAALIKQAAALKPKK